MSEKTAEEKLREELEGRLPKAPYEKEAEKIEPVRKPVKPRTMRSRAAVRKIEKLVNVGQRVDSFMEDFERRIAESLNAENVFSAGRSVKERKAADESSAEVVGVRIAESNEASKKSAVNVARRKRRQSKDTESAAKPEKVESDVLGLAAIAESSEAVPEAAQPLPEPEPEAVPEAAQPIPDTDIDSDTLDDDSANDIPVEIIDESEQEIDDEFPDIPVIDAQEIAESSDNPEENTFPDIPVISPDPEELDDDFSDFSNTDNDIHELSEAPEEPSPAPENHSDFPPFADVVVNVDADLPQISYENQESSSDENIPEDFDPESMAAPVTVAMPESTKTAEDKLMANIAEAMTGSPLTLDKPDPSEPYRLPENLLNPQNDPNFSQQSAEGKLIADISQAISESPIETAQKQANQNFEDEISPFDESPFDEMPLPEPIQTPDFDDAYEQEEGDDFDEPFLPDFSAKDEQQEHSQEESLDEDTAELFSSLGDPDEVSDLSSTDDDSDNSEKVSDLLGTDDDSENTNEVSDLLSTDDNTDDTDKFSDLLNVDDDNDNAEDFAEPFSVPDDEDASDDTHSAEDTENFSELPVAEDDTADFSELPDISLLDEPEIDSEPVNLEKSLDPEPEHEPEIDASPESEPDQESDSQPITAEQRLVQELADFQNHDTSIDPEPEQSLLDEQDTLQEQQAPQTSEDDSGEDFNFMSSWGDAASTMNYGDDEPDSQEQIPETQDTFSQAAQPVASVEPEARITHEPLNIHKPQTSQERFELPHPEVQNAALPTVWRIVLQAVLGLLILAGVSSLFRLHQLTDSVTSMMLYGNTPVNSAQAYDYAVDLIPDEEISSRMRLRGIEGWKIVGSRRTQDTATGRYGYEFIFMRQKPSNH